MLAVNLCIVKGGVESSIASSSTSFPRVVLVVGRGGRHFAVEHDANHRRPCVDFAPCSAVLIVATTRTGARRARQYKAVATGETQTMTATQLHIGDRVGIKDGADFLHWSRFGVITGIADDREASGGSAVTFDVREDGEPAAVHMVSSLLVGLGQPGQEGAPGAWSAQAFPTDGDRPGAMMYFENTADVLEFVVEFVDLRLDEKLKVQGPAWTEEERTRLLDAGVEVGHDGDAGSCPVSLVDELAKLADLRRQGLLSETEFQAAKTRLLSS